MSVLFSKASLIMARKYEAFGKWSKVVSHSSCIRNYDIVTWSDSGMEMISGIREQGT